MNDIASKIKQLLEVGRSIQVVDSLNDLAWEFRRKNLNDAYMASVRSEEIARSLQYEKGISDALKVQGYCLWRFSDYSASMDKSAEALKIARERGDLKSQADILNSIGAVYMFLKDHDNRLKCNLECLRIRTEIGDTEGVAGSLNNLGETYMEMQRYDEAAEYLQKCLDYESSTEADAKGWAYHNLGLLEIKKGNITAGMQFLEDSIALTEEHGYTILTCNSYLHLARCLQTAGQAQKAAEILHKGLKLAESVNAREEMFNIHLALSEQYEREGNLEKAFSHFKLYNQIHNALYNEENDNTIRNLKNQFEVESLQKEAEIERLKNIELKKAFDEIEEQKRIVDKKNKSINDSLQYAKRIQTAILNNEYELDESGLDYFKVFIPKDVVSGDFYWSKLIGSYLYLAVVDCTGHGVPGAFMSMLGVAFLNETSSAQMLPSTNDILEGLREKVITVLKQKGQFDDSSDGMDMSIIRIDLDTLELQFSGAMNPMYIVRDGELIMYKGDRMPIGYTINSKPFSVQELDLESGDQLFLFSDGLADQFGGPDNRKVGYNQFKDWLIEASTSDNPEQLVRDRLKGWQGKESQIDDITLIGLKV